MTSIQNPAAALDLRLLDELTGLVSRAAAAILAASALAARAKADGSPVTAADEASEAIIAEGLARILPGMLVVSEESAAQTATQPREGDLILVDPLDGTREILAGRDEFTINLAIVRGGRPLLGIVAAPALGLIWRTGGPGCGADRIKLPPGAPASAAVDRVPIRTRPWPPAGLVAAVSRSHLEAATEAALARLPITERIVCGSAIKFCRVAEGAADIYPRLSPTCQWDVAAGHAVLVAAGGALTAPDGGPLSYGLGTGSLLVPGFVAWGQPAAVRAIA